ncbi:MAG: hypothetical protein D6729_06870 [Deltaproteobacteria bacterium]|nr:MAG: hypothetical protein D6729_06870 [Deltaproteobacteria bacterium]
MRGLATLVAAGALLWASTAAADGAEGADGSAWTPVWVGNGSFEVRLEVEPAHIVLGRTREVELRVEAPEPPGPERPLRASVNVGRLHGVERLAPGRYRIRYRPPKKRYPQLAVLALWRETGPDAPIAFFRLPLYGVARVPVRTDPRARVFVEVEGHRFGPFRANRRGKVKVELEVPPGVPQAKVIARAKNGKETSASLPLPVPPYNRLTLALVPHAIIADGVSYARLHVYYDAKGGQPPAPSAVRIAAPVGQVGAVASTRPGIYTARYTAPPGTPNQKVRFQVRVEGDEASAATAVIELGRQVPASVSVAVEPSRFLADGSVTLAVRASILDRLGLGVPGLKPEVRLEGAPPGTTHTEVKEVAQGVYALSVKPGAAGPEGEGGTLKIRVSAGKAAGEASVPWQPWTPVSLNVTPESLRLPADGSAAAVLEISVLDAEGRPMPQIEPELSVERGHVEALEPSEGPRRYRYIAPLIRRQVVSREEASPAPVEDRVHIRVPKLSREVPVVLTPEVEVVGTQFGFLEVSGGYGSNLGALGGPFAAVSAGLRVLGHEPLWFSLGLSTGFGERQAHLGAGETADARVRILPLPLLGEVRAHYRPVRSVLLGLGLAGGALLAPGNVRLSGSDDVPVTHLVPAFGGRLFAGYRLGPGTALVDLGYLEARASGERGGADVVGQLGGPWAGVGYRLEL